MVRKSRCLRRQQRLTQGLQPAAHVETRLEFLDFLLQFWLLQPFEE